MYCMYEKSARYFLAEVQVDQMPSECCISRLQRKARNDDDQRARLENVCFHEMQADKSDGSASVVLTVTSGDKPAAEDSNLRILEGRVDADMLTKVSCCNDSPPQMSSKFQSGTMPNYLQRLWSIRCVGGFAEMPGKKVKARFSARLNGSRWLAICCH